MKRSTPDSAKLYQIAEEQQGLFTTKQAKACGYADNIHPYHVRTGHWIRERRGIYRLAQFPVSKEEQLVLWSLWSANRREVPQGVYSHASALAIHELSDIMPAKLHMTVPSAFRRLGPLPKVMVLHRVELTKPEIEPRQGYAVTTPMRTLLDMAAEESTPEDLLEQAVRDALKKGIVPRAQVQASTAPPSSRLRRILGLSEDKP